MSDISKADDDRLIAEARSQRAHLHEVLPFLRRQAELGPRPGRPEARRRIAEVERRLEDLRAFLHHMHR